MKYNKKTKMYIFVVIAVIGIFLLASSFNLIPASIIPFASVAPVNSNGVGVSLSSTTINHPPLLSIFNLVSGSKYSWVLTAKNTGTVAWNGGYVTVRIVPQSNYTSSNPYEVLTASSNPSEFSQYLGLQTGQGVIQKCFTSSTQYTLDSNNCLVTLNGGAVTTPVNESWTLTAGNASVAFGSSSTIATILLPSNLQPGQSVTFSFNLSIPAINPSNQGQYYALQNLVVYTTTQTTGDVANYNVQAFNLSTGGISGLLNTQGITAIGGVGLSIIGLFGAFLERRRT